MTKTPESTIIQMFDIDEIPSGTYQNEGLTYLAPEWIDQYIVQEQGEGARDRAWRELIPQWLRRLGTELPGEYRVDETENFTILQPSSNDDPSALPAHAEHSLDICVQLWEGLNVEQDDAFGKHVAIVAQSQDEYYDYMSAFYPDGSFGGSGGACINQLGSTHIVVNASPLWEQKSTLTHEICHAVLKQLPLPTWIEEGMVQLAEEFINQATHEPPDPIEHRTYWAEHTFAGFWLGSAFHDDGDGQAYAYQLARQIVYDLMVSDRRRFFAFANAANHGDAGSNAALSELGSGLAACLPPYLQMCFESPK